MKWFLGILAVLVAAAVLLLAPIWNLDAAPLPSLTLDWTAPSDNVGVTAYDARWATSRPDTTSAPAMTSWWASATPVAGLPAPLVAGTAQSVTVAPAGGFPEGATYYFVTRSRDAAGNWSLFSNVAWRAVVDATPPTPILDLRIR